jgi:ABC-type transport system involved in Fe-S cluster assembly fused permease/ATPase subunit
MFSFVFPFLHVVSIIYVHSPPICIFDEATSALDTITEQSVKDALDRLGSDRTVLVIAHRLGTIRNADQIIVLSEGRILEQGTHDDLLDRVGGKYAEMWNMQLDSVKAAGSQGSLGLLLSET